MLLHDRDDQGVVVQQAGLLADSSSIPDQAWLDRYYLNPEQRDLIHGQTEVSQLLDVCGLLFQSLHDF